MKFISQLVYLAPCFRSFVYGFEFAITEGFSSRSHIGLRGLASHRAGQGWAGQGWKGKGWACYLQILLHY
jgi:hypothetical protein